MKTIKQLLGQIECLHELLDTYGNAWMMELYENNTLVSEVHKKIRELEEELERLTDES